jgi:hypothetical protein
LATYFSEKFGTQIQRQVIARIIGTPETFRNLPIEALRRIRISHITSTFEQEVYIAICATVKITVLNYENILMIAAQIKAFEKWKLEDEIQKMQFSRNWFTRFKQRFHIKYKLIRGNKVFFPKGDISLEQKRLLTGKIT